MHELTRNHPIGTIATPMVADMQQRTGQEIDTSGRPLARAADPREVATVIEFLLGEGASFVTGTVYNGTTDLYFPSERNNS